MTFEVREILQLIGLLLSFGIVISGGMVAFFLLRGRVGILEARQTDDRLRTKEGFERIEAQLREDRETNRQNFDELKDMIRAIAQDLKRKADK